MRHPDVRITLAMALLLLLFFSFFSYGVNILLHTIIIVFFALLSEFAYCGFKFSKRLWSAFVTGLLLAMILAPVVSWNGAFIVSSWTALVALALSPIIAVSSKYFIRFHNRHIFNPASIILGLLAFVASFNNHLVPFQSWWGAGSEWWFVITIVFFGAYLVYRIRRWHIALSFLIVTAIFSFILTKEIYGAISSGILFYAFFMLSEPKTSSQVISDQIIVGSISAIIAVLFSRIAPASNLIIGLIFGNAITALLLWKRS